MKKKKVIILIIIIAVIAIAAVSFGVHYLMDAYARYQREEQLTAASGNQASGGQQFPSYVQNLIRTTMDSPEESGICGEHLEWYYKDEVLVITGTGKMDEYIYSAGSAPWYDSLGNQIGCVILDEGVTSIGDAAFEGCGSLTEIFLPSSLTYIGERGFCNCSSLMQVSLPDGVTSIGESAFSGCSGLQEIILSDSLANLS